MPLSMQPSALPVGCPEVVDALAARPSSASGASASPWWTTAVLALERMDGAGPQTPEIATRKAWTAAMVRLPTKTVEDMAKDRPGLLGMPGQLRVQGGLPIQVEGEWVGAVGVSGVASHEDEQVARAGITALG
jgi:uncharacterized protein GlcG (DUF336 family)